MANKYLGLNSGVPTEVEGLISSAGAGDSGKIVALDATGRLSTTMMPVGIGADVSTVTASENLSAGDLVSIWNDGGTAKVRKADATTTGKPAHGFVLTAVTSGNSAFIYHEGPITGLSGVTAGDLYLSTTAGGFTVTPPSGSGNVVQRIGVGTSATEINFEPGQRYVLA